MEINCPYCFKQFSFEPSEPVETYELNPETVESNKKEYVTHCKHCGKLVIA